MKFKVVLLVFASLVAMRAWADHYVAESLNITNPQAPELTSSCGLGIHPNNPFRVVGDLAGISNDTLSGQLPFLWDRIFSGDAPPEDDIQFPGLLNVEGIGLAHAINLNDIVVGVSDSVTTLNDAVIYDLNGRVVQANGQRFAQKAVILLPTLQDLGTLGGEESEAFDINDTGDIVGWAELADTGIFEYFDSNDAAISVTRRIYHAFRHDGTTMTDLGSSLLESQARAINNVGDVVGWEETGNTATETNPVSGETRQRQLHQAVYWPAGGTKIELGFLTGGNDSEALDINEQGQIVGYSTDDTGLRRAFVWDATNGMQSLGALAADAQNIATAINDNGQIVGIETSADGTTITGIFYDVTLGQLDAINGLLNADSSEWNITQPQDIDNRGVVTGCGYKGVGNPIEAFILTSAVADLQVVVQPTPNPVTVGNTMSISIPVANLGPNSATNVVTTITLPGSLDVVSAIPQLGACSQSGNIVTCTLGSIQAQTVNLILLKAEPQKDGNVIISASVTSDQEDPNMANNVYTTSSKADACFIATAAYGSFLDPQVTTLRRFRDEVLKPLPGGPGLVATYYKWSPPLAGFIQRHGWAKTLTRAVLTPIIYSIRYPWLLLAGAFVMLWIYRRRRPLNTD